MSAVGQVTELLSMIGVIADASEHHVIREFFELFKTPWELYRSGRRYDVIICSGDGTIPHNSAKLILIYAGRQISLDTNREIEVISRAAEKTFLLCQDIRVPIYGECVTFSERRADFLQDKGSAKAAMHVEQSPLGLRVRLGYDLFGEVRTLLTVGQPAANAGVPALELHIDILRKLIVSGGVPLLEISPAPEGYRFIACLTHDVDHPSIRNHFFDHTMFGFLYRALIGSITRVCRGRNTLHDLLSNWWAVAKLPFIYLGIAKDIWSIVDSYASVEKELPSSFFVIPFRDCPGWLSDVAAPKRRASSYRAADIALELRSLSAAGREIGVHGIDAWHDPNKARSELEEISRITGTSNMGIRMHWLYYDQESPAVLESVGFDYDSTVGYNETVGYRAGTTQAYRPLGCKRLIELPLHIMDTALFYPSYLNLHSTEAGKLVSSIIDNAVQFGGVVTVNWHDRSTAPERCWADFYINVVRELKNRGAWFATAADAVAWFRKRREAIPQKFTGETDLSNVNAAVGSSKSLPALHLQLHHSRKSTDIYNLTHNSSVESHAH